MSRSRSIVVAECVVVPVMSDSMSESVSETVRVRVSVTPIGNLGSVRPLGFRDRLDRPMYSPH